MIWHYEGPRHVELSNREQQLLGISKAFPNRDELSEVLFTPRRPSWRAERARALAADILVYEMAHELPDTFSHEGIFDVEYDMAPLKRPGVILGEDIASAKFVHTHTEAELLGLPERYADDGQPCGGTLNLVEVLPEGADSLWHYRDELRENWNDASGPVKDGLSAVGSAFTGQDAMAQYRLDMDARIACADAAIDYITEWYNVHCL